MTGIPSRTSAAIFIPAAVALLAVFLGCAGAPASISDTGSRTGGEQPGAPAATPGAGPVGQQPAADLPDGTLVVRTGDLSLEVTDLTAAVDAGRRAVAGYGGYIGASQEQHQSGGGWASVTYRIPVERWEDALAALRGIGRVLDQHTEALDVTSQVVDLDARIANLRVTEAALQAIMDRATTIADVLKVQGELTTVRGQIERLVAERETLAKRAALATLTVSYGVPTIAGAGTVEGWDFGRQVESAVNSLALILQGLASLGIWLGIVVLPVFGPVALIAYVVWRYVRWREIRATMQPTDPQR